MRKRWVLISMFTAVLLSTTLPAGEAQDVERASTRDGQGMARPAIVASTEPRSVLASGVTVGELGEDFQLSSMGADGDTDYGAYNPAVAYNSTDNQYLVVWSGSKDVVGEFEIWGQLMDATNGAQVGSGHIRISHMGPDDEPTYDARHPDVAYNSAENEYLVVWHGDHTTNEEYEIWGQRVNAVTGALLGSVIRISAMGPDGNTAYMGLGPSVAHNSTDNQYLVVWYGDDDDPLLAVNEYEIWGRRLDADGNWLDPAHLRLSDMGGLGDVDYKAVAPSAAYNSTDNQYMVVWWGDDSGLDRTDNEYEVFGQRLNASGAQIGVGDFRISTMGPNNDPAYDASRPHIAYNAIDNEYLVVWAGEDLEVDAYDIFGQRLSYDGIQVGDDDFRLSEGGNGPNGDYDARHPAVAHDLYNNEYLVVWDDDELGADELEIWGQRLNGATGAQIDGDVRLSDMGPDGDADFVAHFPAVAHSSAANNQYLVVWHGDDSTDGEFEVWGQRFFGAYGISLPLVLTN